MITDNQARKLMDKQVFQWVAMKALVVEDGKLLLGTRLDKNDYGLFELPGGKLEKGETFTGALQREVLEETGVEVEPVEVSDDSCKSVTVLDWEHSIVFLVVKAKPANKGALQKETEELGEIGFYSKEQIKTLLDEGKVRPIYQKLLTDFVKGELNG